jgi:hypothetical protein
MLRYSCEGRTMGMAKLHAVPGGKGKDKTVCLVYGVGLFPARRVAQLTAGQVGLGQGRSGRVPLHLIEGTRDHVRAQLLASLDAFFDICVDEEAGKTASSARRQTEEATDAGC